MQVSADQTRQAQIFERLRTGILTGVLRPGSRLPPTRAMAAEMGVARQTVVLAYERLAAEGYTSARVGAGTFVAADLPDEAPAPRPPPEDAAAALSARGRRIAELSATALPHGEPGLLTPGVPAPELFPARAWAASTARVLRGLDPTLTRYPDPQGLPALRSEIAAHLAATRGLAADPECIVVTAGTQQALRVAAELLIDPDDQAWVEEPGYISGRGALTAAGATLVPVQSDEEGIDVAAGIAAAPGARLALVAPSHATPLGGALPVARRLALLDWAAGAGAWLLEDDCDSEYRWQGKPLPPLASLDRSGRVIYCGTFSKTLAPALRIGFAVVPRPLVAAFRRARQLMDRGPNAIEQAVLADFMARGLLAPHVRRMRTEFARRRAALLQAIARQAAPIWPIAAPGGLHLSLRLRDGEDDRTISRRAAALGLSVAPLSAYFQGVPRFPGLVAGFAGTPVALAADAARRLATAVRG